MKRTRMWHALILAGAMTVYAPAAPAQDAEAQAILKQARDAAGGDAKLKGVQSLNFSAKSKMMMRMMTSSGGGAAQPSVVPQEAEYEVDVLAPDKYVRKDTREISLPNGGGGTVINFRGFNGSTPIQRTERIGDFPDFTPQRPDPAELLRRHKLEFLRMWLGWSMEPAAAFGVSYRGAGNEDVNGTKYNIVEATAPDSFSVKLYFDAGTHRLGMIRYKAPGMQMMRTSGPPPGSAPPAEGQGAQHQTFTRQSMGGGTPGPETEVEITFSEYKAVDGIHLPHRIRRTTNGDLSEETEIKRFRVNPNLKADKFKTNN